MIGGRRGVLAKGPADHLDGTIRLAALERDQTKQVQGVGVVGIAVQDSPVDFLRLRETPGLVVLQPGGQGVAGVSHIIFIGKQGVMVQAV